MHSKDHTLLISPIGELDGNGELLDQLRMEIHNVFGYETRLLSLLEEKDLPADPIRKQVHSTPILETLALLAPPETLKILAITRVDLFIPVLTHVYGEAQLGGKACILSTYRFFEKRSSTPESFRCRMLKEAIHELGHTFGLRHCRDAGCVMHYCRSVSEVDRKSSQFCRYCAVLLQDEMKRMGQGKLGPP